MSIPTAYVATPTVLIDGQANDGLGLDLLSMLVEETTEGLYRAEVSFNNFGVQSGGSNYLYFGRDILDFGKELSLLIGPGDLAASVFTGRISAIEANFPPQANGQITVLAEDRLQGLRMTRRTRSFEDVSDEDVISQIANEHGLTPQLDLGGPTYKVLTQVNQSDLAFARDRARSAGAELWIEDTTLHVAPRTDRDGSAVSVAYGSSLISFSVRADLAQQCSELDVTGWDVAAKDAIDESADDSALGAELNGGTSGGAILQRAFALRREQLVHLLPLTSAEAQTLAQARYRERARRFLTGSGIADGDPRIQVGKTVMLSGLGSLFNGSYYVTRTRHTYDLPYGFRTEFDVERPGLGPAGS